jgi:hypothetical protein
MSCRSIAVHRIWRDGPVLYVQGVCQLRHAVRTFRVDRTTELVCLATGEVADDPAAWLKAHAFLDVAVPESDYTPHAIRLRRDELAILAFLANADGHLDDREVDVAVDLVMMSTPREVDRDRIARYLKRLSASAIDLEEAVNRVSGDEMRWDILRRSMRRLVDADREWPLAEQLAVEDVEALARDASLRHAGAGAKLGKWKAALELRLVAGHA